MCVSVDIWNCIGGLYMSWEDLIPQQVRDLYEIHNYNHAAEVLSQGCPEEFNELLNALVQFSITTDEILAPGGNESQIPKKFSELLRPLNWFETRIQGDLLIKLDIYGNPQRQVIEKRISNFIDGHKIDYVKNRVAFDLEWNSKDQTFDRDLYAFRAFHECGIISAAVIITRSAELNDIFRSLNVMHKYGASTTWMGKLLPRLETGRHGGCPVLALGITKELVTDWVDRRGGRE